MYAQKARYYMHIPNKKDVPIATKSLKANDSKVILQSANEDLSNTINKYNVTKFEQAFPTAVTDWLREVYYIECDSINANAKTSLSEAISPQLKKSIPIIEEIVSEAVSTGGSVYTPTDPKYISDASYRAQMELIRAPETWDIVRRYPKINVAIHDTYFESHVDLNYTHIIQNIQQGGNSVHGAFVAGCLGATTDNNEGIASLGGLNTNLVVTTKNWAKSNEVLLLAQAGYKVINCSWVNGDGAIVADLYKEIRDIHNTVVVFGAGNGKATDGNNIRKRYPASFEYVLSVTSVGHKYNIGHSGNKNWKDVHEFVIGDESSTHHHNDAVDICAPGYDVLSTMSGGYSESDGTSFAAPQVAAAAALVRIVNPSLTAKQVIDVLKSTADASIYDIPQNRKYKGLLGTGRLDAYAAVKKACSVDLVNKTFSNETYSGCIIGIKNSTIPASRTLTLNATKEVNFEGSFSINNGTLNVVYTGLPL